MLQRCRHPWVWSEQYVVKPKENEPVKEESDKSKKIKVEGNDQNVLDYLYN